jgi:dTDP-4-dehydrorhamnose reductase
MKTVLVTGGNGQLASCIKDIESNYLDLKFIYKNASELDITDQEQIKILFESNKIDWCINCAAYTAVDKAESESELAFKINAEGAKFLAEASRKHKVKLIHISTDFVFNGNKTNPYTEQDTPNPINVYGASKLEGEKHIESILKAHYIIRTSWLYSKHSNNFVKTMLKLSLDRDELSVVNDQIGSPTHALDLAHTILKIIDKDNNAFGLYHFSNQGDISWYQFATTIFNVFNRKINVHSIPSGQFNTLAKRPRYSVLDSNKITAKFQIDIKGWKTALIEFAQLQ